MVWSATGIAFIHTRWCRAIVIAVGGASCAPGSRLPVPRSIEVLHQPRCLGFFVKILRICGRTGCKHAYIGAGAVYAGSSRLKSTLFHRCTYLQCELCCRALGQADGGSADSETSDIFVSSDQQGDSEQQQGRQASSMCRTE